MNKRIQYDDEVIFVYDTLVYLNNLRFKNTIWTLASMPNNFRFIEDPNPPATIVAEEEPEVTSLVV
jgi:hypothetical protein